MYPWIAGPVKETRDGVVDVRATTLRATVLGLVARDTTLRFVAVPRDTVFAFARDATPRDTTFLFTVAPVVVRAIVAGDTPRFVVRPDARFVAFVRGDALVSAGTNVGAIGSANTARIDKNVEQTKNAPAKRNTVPIAFFATDAISRLFIRILPADANAHKSALFMVCQTANQHHSLSLL